MSFSLPTRMTRIRFPVICGAVATSKAGFRVPVPYTLVYGIVSLAFATVFKRNEKLPHVLVPCRFESRLKPLRYTNRRAAEVLDWHPPFDYAECLRRSYS